MANKLNNAKSERLYEEAQQLIPGGVLGIRRPYNFVPGEYPIFIDRGKGGDLWDVDGNKYIDMLCSYGPIILGHCEEEVDEAVIKQVRDKGFCFNLAQDWQNLLAEKLIEHLPCAEMAYMVKTGSDATTSAIRIARGYTDKAKILRCGYHGWHDWCVEVKGGIPENLYEDVHEWRYNDLNSLEDLLKAHDGNVAGIIVTPLGHPLAHDIEEPKPGFLEGVRKLADEHGAVLIFDEIRTGFRVSMGGAGAYYGVTPDLVTIGKAMANGYSISAVAGKKEFISLVGGKVFVSSTFFPNSLEMVAAMKTIEIMERENVLDDIWRKGNMLLDGWKKAVADSGIEASVNGIAPMPFITFNRMEDGRHKARRAAFYGGLIRRGIFLAPYHHGYVCWRHSDKDIQYTIDMAAETLKEIKDTIG